MMSFRIGAALTLRSAFKMCSGVLGTGCLGLPRAITRAHRLCVIVSREKGAVGDASTDAERADPWLRLAGGDENEALAFEG
jgi:hypothetical protein